MSHPSRALLSGAFLATVASALIAATVALPVTPASAVSSDVVISEVYGGGGNSGATLTNDFVELHNAGDVAVDVTGWSVQYASCTGSSWRATYLPGTLAPGQRYLVQQAQGNGGTTPLPTPDATGSIAMSGSQAKVALATNADALTCATDCTGDPAVRDFIGWGNANDFEGDAAAPTLDNETSNSRQGEDTDQNAADFTEGAPSPTNSAGEGGEPEPPTEVEGLEIHDIQGAAHTSPYAGDLAGDVPGVIAAVGDNGFWMQSTTPDDDVATSEGIFVFTGSSPTVSAGDSVSVTGEVEEYRAGNDNLTVTELSGPDVNVVGKVPSTPSVQLVGPGGRVPPAKVIDDDAAGSVETSGSFDATQDGIDFWESMEGMQVAIENAEVTGPTSRFGEVPVLSLIH